MFCQEGTKEILEDCHDREREVDALRLLLERQVGQILESASIEDSLGTSRWEASEIGKVVRTLERMGDHSYALCKLSLNRSDDSPNFNKLCTDVVNTNLEILHEAFNFKSKEKKNFRDSFGQRTTYCRYKSLG